MVEQPDVQNERNNNSATTTAEQNTTTTVTVTVNCQTLQLSMHETNQTLELSAGIQEKMLTTTARYCNCQLPL